MTLDMTDARGTFNVTWISVAMGIPVKTSQAGGHRLMDATVQGGSAIRLAAPYKGGWVAAIARQ